MQFYYNSLNASIEQANKNNDSRLTIEKGNLIDFTKSRFSIEMKINNLLLVFKYEQPTNILYIEPLDWSKDENSHKDLHLLKDYIALLKEQAPLDMEIVLHFDFYFLKEWDFLVEECQLPELKDIFEDDFEVNHKTTTPHLDKFPKGQVSTVIESLNVPIFFNDLLHTTSLLFTTERIKKKYDYFLDILLSLNDQKIQFSDSGTIYYIFSEEYNIKIKLVLPTEENDYFLIGDEKFPTTTFLEDTLNFDKLNAPLLKEVEAFINNPNLRYTFGKQKPFSNIHNWIVSYFSKGSLFSRKFTFHFENKQIMIAVFDEKIPLKDAQEYLFNPLDLRAEDNQLDKLINQQDTYDWLLNNFEIIARRKEKDLTMMRKIIETNLKNHLDVEKVMYEDNPVLNFYYVENLHFYVFQVMNTFITFKKSNEPYVFDNSDELKLFLHQQNQELLEQNALFIENNF